MILFANSCELGIGGGKKVDEGDGNGDADEGVSTANVSLGWADSVADGSTAERGNEGPQRQQRVRNRLWGIEDVCEMIN